MDISRIARSAMRKAAGEWPPTAGLTPEEAKAVRDSLAKMNMLEPYSEPVAAPTAKQPAGGNAVQGGKSSGNALSRAFKSVGNGYRNFVENTSDALANRMARVRNHFMAARTAQNRQDRAAAQTARQYGTDTDPAYTDYHVTTSTRFPRMLRRIGEFLSPYNHF